MLNLVLLVVSVLIFNHDTACWQTILAAVVIQVNQIYRVLARPSLEMRNLGIANFNLHASRGKCHANAQVESLCKRKWARRQHPSCNMIYPKTSELPAWSPDLCQVCTGCTWQGAHTAQTCKAQAQWRHAARKLLPPGTGCLGLSVSIRRMSHVPYFSLQLVAFQTVQEGTGAGPAHSRLK